MQNWNSIEEPKERRNSRHFSFCELVSLWLVLVTLHIHNVLEWGEVVHFTWLGQVKVSVMIVRYSLLATCYRLHNT
jgi:hypothetical protein